MERPKIAWAFPQQCGCPGSPSWQSPSWSPSCRSLGQQYWPRSNLLHLRKRPRSTKWQPRQEDGRHGLVGELDGSWATGIVCAPMCKADTEDVLVSGARLGSGPRKHPSGTGCLMAGQGRSVKTQEQEVCLLRCIVIIVVDPRRPCVMGR
jgi:hypothetical protein